MINNKSVVSLTNPTKEDFSHPYGGVPLFVKAGETKMFTLIEGKHLAKHLARKILLSENDADKKIIGEEKGKGRELYTLEQEQKLINRILGTTITPEEEAEPTERERMDARITQLEKDYKKDIKSDREEAVEDFDLKESKKKDDNDDKEDDKDDDEFKDKADVIKALEAKQQKVDRRKPKKDLEKQLKELLEKENSDKGDKK